MLKFSNELRDQMAQNMRDFIEKNPDDPLLAEYAYPAREFSVQVRDDSIAIIHPSLPLMFLE